MNHSQQQSHLGRALDVAIHLGVLGVLVFGSFRIFSPFLVAFLWGAVIAVATFPMFLKVQGLFGGRRKLTGVLFIVVALAALLVPIYFLGDSLLGATVGLVHKAEAGNLNIPPPTEKVKQWPVIGERVFAVWQGASVDLQGTAAKLQPQLRNFGEKIIGFVGGLGKSLLQTLFAIVIAGSLMITAQGTESMVRAVFVRLAGEQGPKLMALAVGTVRSVFKGVILVAVIQGLLAAIGMAIVGVPGVGLWALLVMIAAVIQLPSILILAPIAIWVFAQHESTGMAIFFAIWSLGVTLSDNVLKPIFLGRGVQVPMLIILVGAIGGMLRSGVIGLFIGPVILAIFYSLFLAWMGRRDVPELSR